MVFNSFSAIVLPSLSSHTLGNNRFLLNGAGLQQEEVDTSRGEHSAPRALGIVRTRVLTEPHYAHRDIDFITELYNVD